MKSSAFSGNAIFLILLSVICLSAFTGCPAKKDSVSGASSDVTEVPGTPVRDEVPVAADVETEEVNWKDEASALEDSGYINLGDVSSDKAAFLRGKSQKETWDAGRERLRNSLPDFHGSEADYNQAVMKFGPILEQENIELKNIHYPEQTDTLIHYVMNNMTGSIYIAMEDPPRYLNWGITITGPVGVTELDNLFEMTPEEIFARYGQMEQTEDGYWPMDPSYTDFYYSHFQIRFEGDKLREISCHDDMP